MLSWCFCHILTPPAECHCRNQDKTLAQDKTQALHTAQHTQCSLCSEECLDRYTDLLHICTAQHRRNTSVGRDSAGYLHLSKREDVFDYANVPMLEQEDRGDIFKYKWSSFNRDGGLQHQESAAPTTQFWSLFASRSNPRSHNDERDGAKSHKQLTTWWKWPLTTCCINSGPIIPRIMSKGRIPLEIEYQGFSTSCFWTEKGSWKRGPVSFSSSATNWPR